MFAFGWLFFWLHIILSPLTLTWLLPFFLVGIFITAQARSTYNSLVVGFMGALHQAWFGYDPVILMLVMVVMFMGYMNSSGNVLPERLAPALAISFLIIEYVITAAIHPDVVSPVSFTTVIAKVLITWYTLRYFDRKARAQYV